MGQNTVSSKSPNPWGIFNLKLHFG